MDKDLELEVALEKLWISPRGSVKIPEHIRVRLLWIWMVFPVKVAIMYFIC